MTATLLAFSLLSFGVDIDLEVNVRNAEVIAGERTFRVRVNSNRPVTQVEFYIGGDLRDSDSSTPYEFRLDTLTEEDGPALLKFIAYNNEGKSASKSVRVTIDNGLSKGLGHHLGLGQEALRNSKWDEAILAARIAQKIDADEPLTKLILARAYLGKGVLDQAQRNAEDYLALKPDEIAAKELLGAVNVQKAFTTVARTGGSAEALTTIRAALARAIELRKQVLDERVDKFGEVTDANRMAYADALIRARRYSLAITQLQQIFRSDYKRPDAGNRLAYAQLMSGRYMEAGFTLDEIRKISAPNAYTYALDAVLRSEFNETARTDKALREAILANPDDPATRTAQAFVALKRNQAAALLTLAMDLARDESRHSEVNIFLAALASRLGEYGQARNFFERAVLIDPTNFYAYVEEGNNAIAIAAASNLEGSATTRQMEVAQVMFETALLARPESHQALTGLALVQALRNRPADAMRLARAATAASSNYASAHLLTASLLWQMNQPQEASVAMTRAARLDSSLEGLQQPRALTVWRYYIAKGRTPLITPPN